MPLSRSWCRRTWVVLSLLHCWVSCVGAAQLDRSGLETLRDACLQELGDETGSRCSSEACTQFSAADTSAITDFGSLFDGKNTVEFTCDLSAWNTSAVTSMTSMFYSSYFKGDISKWDVSAVTDMSNMFGFSSFNGDLSAWNVAKVKYMGDMFWTSAFNGDISKWNVASVESMYSMFQNTNFNGNISAWDTSTVVDMEYMFSDSTFNGDISAWDTSALEYAEGMFDGASFSGDLCPWDFSQLDSSPSSIVDNSNKEQVCECEPLPQHGACEQGLTTFRGAPPWGKAEFASCQDNSTWWELFETYGDGGGPAPRMVTGGLGRMWSTRFGVWACLEGHPCLQNIGGTTSDFMCFVYDETDKHFVPWGKKSELVLF